MKVSYRTQTAGEVEVFYREAGPAGAPVLLLLHGYPTSSHMFRDLIPLLADRYHVIAPDLIGFGNTIAPPRGAFEYSFDRMADVLEAFVDALALDRYALYIFDYGAPAGLRLAMRHPHRISAIITQNGNAYEEGLGTVWDGRRAYWRDPTPENREACRYLTSAEAIRGQYAYGTPAEWVPPDNYLLDIAFMERPGMREIQLDLILSYGSNVALYPRFQHYFREHRPPLLAVWGKNDRSFLPAGAEAFRRDIADAEIVFFDTGHFALATHHQEIAAAMRDFLARRLA